MIIALSASWSYCDSNARSIKTRIETYCPLEHANQRFCIRMQDPLKQGLKLQWFDQETQAKH